MAEVNPCFVLSTQTHNSEILRSVIRSLRLGAGPVGATDLAVSAGGGMNVSVAFGRAVIDGSESVLQGSYVVYNDAAVIKAIAASDGTNPRRDLVCARVLDQDYSGASRLWQLAVITGTPAASPLLPALPANAIPLADVLVPALSGSVSGGNITDLRTPVGLGSDQTRLQPVGTAAAGSRLDVARLDHVHPDTLLTRRIDSQLVSGVASIIIPPAGVLPTNFRNLRIKWKLRSAAAVAADNINVRFNGSAVANYTSESGQILNGAVTSSEVNTSPATALIAGALAGANAPANNFGAGEITIFDYNSAADVKFVTFYSIDREGTGASGMRYQFGGGAWIIAPVAITAITLLATGNLSGRVDTYGEY